MPAREAGALAHDRGCATKSGGARTIDDGDVLHVEVADDALHYFGRTRATSCAPHRFATVLVQDNG